MAALTESSVTKHSMGDLTLHIVEFGSITTDGDTWTSKLPNIVNAWSRFHAGTSSGLMMATIVSSTTLKFYPSAAVTASVYVLSQT